MSDTKATVLVIDDDQDFRESIGRLLRSLDLDVLLFASVSEFLRSNLPDTPICVVLDVRLPGQSGLDLQRELVSANRLFPIIFVTGHGDIPMSVQAMKGGAIEFLTKPFRDQDLLDAIQTAIERDRVRRAHGEAIARLQKHRASLTQREREVMGMVVPGRRNKEIAAALGLSEITVKAHRGNVMRKMHARSLADLVRMANAVESFQPRS
jgi:FixJ family two-component response regulator